MPRGIFDRTKWLEAMHKLKGHPGWNIKPNKGSFKPGHRNSPTTEFKPGQEPWNKGSVGVRMSPETEFKPGVHSSTFKGYGVPNVCQGKRIEVYATTPDQETRVSRGRKYVSRKRTTYARWVMGYKDIPAGHIVYHKDGNVLNNHPYNLEIISRAELLKRNRDRR